MLRRLGDAVLGLIQSRLHLVALELQSERVRLVDALFWLGIGLAVGGLGLALAAFALALAAWEVGRYSGLLVLIGLFLGSATAVLVRLRNHLRKGPLPFARTIAEFRKDRACLVQRD
jgi:uncharacterized membrane protein YqjE